MFLAVRANIDKNQYQRLYRKVRKVAHSTKIDGKTLPYFLGIEFRNLLLKNIYSDKYAGSFEGYGYVYGPWKAKKYPGKPFFILREQTVKAIGVFQEQKAAIRNISERIALLLHCV